MQIVCEPSTDAFLPCIIALFRGHKTANVILKKAFSNLHNAFNYILCFLPSLTIPPPDSMVFGEPAMYFRFWGKFMFHFLFSDKSENIIPTKNILKNDES